MFKKPDYDDGRPEPKIHPSEPTMPPAHRSRAAASIGPTIQINGDVSGNEDLTIDGQVDGTINLKENVLTVGKEGQVNATVNARTILVEGKVEGDLKGDEQVIVQRSGNVRGNIVAPRVTLEDGCKFKGSIDMDVEPAASSRASGSRGQNIADIKSAASGSGEATTGGGLGKIPSQ